VDGGKILTSHPRPYDLYFVELEFEDAPGIFAKHPALLIKIGNDYSKVFKISSQYNNKPQEIQKIYYPIKQLDGTGLWKKSYVDTHHFYKVSSSFLFKNKAIGKLSDIDKHYLSEFVNTHKKEIQKVQEMVKKQRTKNER
jgi:hypothetical protein